ncbi:MAG: aldo/keto reductase [Chitinophagaceae bacterium]|nr:aldo/keto reductase [Chitinophagaceae bacterium]
MIKRSLGKTGIQVSEIAFGGVEIGMPYGIGIKNNADMVSQSEAVYLLHAALENGINFFDTARLYGNSEAIIGKAFKDKRDEIILCTKCSHFRNDDGSFPGYETIKTIIENSLKESLEALQTDYVDVFMLHQGDIQILENNDVAKIFTDLKESGIIRATGVSTYTPGETEMAINSGNWDVIQLPYNLMDQRQAALFSLASEKGIGIVVRSVLMKGLLSSRGKNLHPALKNVEDHLSKYNQVFSSTCEDLPAASTKFALSFKEVSSVLVGIDKMEYLQKSLEAADGNYFNETTLQLSRQLAYPDPAFLNLHEWNVKGWLI